MVRLEPMHELPVTQNILEIGIKTAEQAKASRILKINLVIGQFASIIDDSVQFYWQMIAKNTIAEGSQLIFDRIPAEFECRDCHSCTNWTEALDKCPNGGSVKLSLCKGTEFFIESIEVE